MLKKIILSITFLTLPLISLADELQINDEAPKTYVVEKGDTLWDISAIFLEQPWLWPKLWRLNPDINNPHLIYPGDVLQLVFDEQGEPMLIVAEPEPILEPPKPVVKVKPSYKLSPKVRSQVKDEPISTLPLEVIAPYIKYDSMFTQAQLDLLPYIIGSDEGYKSSIDGFKVYVNNDLELAKSYAIYQQGEEIIDPETEESLGYDMKLVGTAQAIRTGDIANKKPATLKVNTAKREIRSGDYVVPINQGQLLPSFFTMRAAAESFRGVIIKSSSNGREFGKFEVVMINRGAEHQVRAGDVMAIKRKSPSVVNTKSGPIYAVDAPRWSRMANSEDSDYDMPEESLGEIMVFKVYDRTSMALILRTDKPARLEDVVTAP